MTKKQQQDTFEKLSIILTGFSKADLTGTGMLEPYWSVVQNEISEEVLNSLLQAIDKLTIKDLEELSVSELSEVNAIVEQPAFKNVVKQIIQLWYLGEWIVEEYSPQNYIVSSQSYLEGLIWKAIQAHPMGGKQPGFGTWAFPPKTVTTIKN